MREIRRSRLPLFLGSLLGLAVSSVGVRWSVGPFNASLLVGFLALSIIGVLHFDVLSRYRLRVLDIALIVFVVVMYLTELVNAEQLIRGANPYLSYMWTFYLFAYISVRLVVQSKEALVSFLNGFVVVAPFMSIFAMLQTLRVPTVVDLTLSLTSGGASALSQFGDEARLVRSTGLIGHWTGFGSYLCVATLALLVLMSLDGSSVRRVAFLLLIGLGITTTYTFSVIFIYLGLVACHYLQMRKPARLFILTILGIFLALFAFGDAIMRRITEQYGANNGAFASSAGLIPETLVYRMRVWGNETIPAISERPLTGWGHAVYGELGEWPIGPHSILWTSPESQWFGILMQGGILGGTVLLFVIWACIALARQLPSAQRLLFYVFIFSCVFVSFTVPQFTNTGLPYALIVLLGGVSCLTRENLRHTNSRGHALMKA